MASTFNSTLSIKNNSFGSGSYELSTRKAEYKHSFSKTLAAGSGASQIDFVMTADGTIGAGSSVTWDLDDGTAIKDLFENLGAFATVKKIIVENTGTTNALTISGDFCGISTQTISLPAGGIFLWYFGASGKAVTTTTADEITLASTSGTNYEIVVEGVHA
jgi:hypothetical protein